MDVRTEAQRRGVLEQVEERLTNRTKFTFEDLTVSPFAAELHELANLWLADQANPTLPFLADIQRRGRRTSPAQAKGILNCMLASMRQSTVRENGVTEPGVYRLNGEVFKVQKSRGSDRLYAKRLIALSSAQGDRLATTGAHVRWQFEYAPGAVYRLSPEDRMTEVDAASFGQEFGICANCGKHLEVADSIERGIGPVCARNFRW